MLSLIIIMSLSIKPCTYITYDLELQKLFVQNELSTLDIYCCWPCDLSSGHKFNIVNQEIFVYENIYVLNVIFVGGPRKYLTKNFCQVEITVLALLNKQLLRS